MSNSKQTGRDGESLAVFALREDGYEILARNYQSRIGEIDIIARKDGVVCFVEVKARNDDNPAAAWEAVHLQKQRKLTRLALEYMQKFKIQDANARFDVVAVYKDSEGNLKAEILKNAFEAVY